jgi:hypothetical protein
MSEVPTPPEDSVFFHVMMRRYATRGVVNVNFKTKTAAHGPGPFREPLAFPQRRPVRVAVYRAVAGETLGYFHQRVLELHGTQTPVGPAGDVVFDGPEHLVRPPPEGNGVLFVEQVLDVHHVRYIGSSP